MPAPTEHFCQEHAGSGRYFRLVHFFARTKLRSVQAQLIAVRREHFGPSLPSGLRARVDRIMRRIRRLFRITWRWHVFTAHVVAPAHDRRHRSIPVATPRHVTKATVCQGFSRR